MFYIQRRGVRCRCTSVNSGVLKMYKTVEFMGMPHSGIAEQAKLLKRALEKNGLESRIHEGGKENIPFEKQILGGPRFNERSAEEVISKLLRYQGRLPKLDRLLFEDLPAGQLLIVKRGIWDHIAWFIALEDQKVIKKKEFQKAIDYVKCFYTMENGVVLICRKPEDIIKEHLRSCDSSGPVVKLYGEVINPSFLDSLKEAYIQTFKMLRNKNRHVIVNGYLPAEEQQAMIQKFVYKKILK